MDAEQNSDVKIATSEKGKKKIYEIHSALVIKWRSTSTGKQPGKLLTYHG